jgi:hypothetical protein
MVLAGPRPGDLWGLPFSVHFSSFDVFFFLVGIFFCFCEICLEARWAEGDDFKSVGGGDVVDGDVIGLSDAVASVADVFHGWFTLFLEVFVVLDVEFHHVDDLAAVGAFFFVGDFFEECVFFGCH